MKLGIRQPPCAGEMGFGPFCEWAAETGFEVVDVPRLTAEVKQTLDANGLVVGTVDLPAWGGGLSLDPERRQAALKQQKEVLAEAKDNGAKVIFTVLLPEDATQPRAKSFEAFKEGFPPLIEWFEEQDLHLAIEGWPGPDPWLPALGCTPETLRAMFEVIPSPNMGLNYDPSHLIRLGVDHERFLWEFGKRVKHVHGKDTELLEENQYLTGNVPGTFGPKYGFGDMAWRYTIPGEGISDWKTIGNRLKDFGFDGYVCVELEDHNYFPSVEQQQEGMSRALAYLAETLG